MAKYSDNPKKKLSKLQKKILILAYQSGKDSITNRKVLTKVYGFKPLKDIETSGYGALIFDRKAIGANKYNSVSVSVAKSLNRLIDRGLITWGFSGGFVLMDKGKEVAKRLRKQE